MTKEEFLKEVNFQRNPKYKLSDIHQQTPLLNTSAIFHIKDKGIYIGRYIVGNGWEIAHFESTGLLRPSQVIKYTPIKGEVLFWIH